MKKSIYIAVFMYLALSCTKVGSDMQSDVPMVFDLKTPDVAVTKTELDAGNISSHNVFLYGTRNSSVIFNGRNLTTQNATTNFWVPAGGGTWTASSFYEFYAYAYNTPADEGCSLILNNTMGTDIDITQPVQDHANTIDYLYSYRYETRTGTDGKYPVVPLQLEHAMAKVSVDVIVAQAMTTRGEIDITLTLEGIYNDATMACTPKKYDVAGTNLWSVSNIGNTTATYTYSRTVSADADDDVEIPEFMSFMAIPVISNQMSGYSLTLTYEIYKRDGEVKNIVSTYSREFPLQGVTVGWYNGHHVRYSVTVDNSIHLSGSILDFIETDYIEGAVLPDLS